MARVRTVDEIVGILENGNLDELVGTAEDLLIEVKGEPYRLSSGDSQKQELAKDVSALANSAGGIILLGFRTTRDPRTSLEEIECCRPFDQSLFNPVQYRDILQEWVHPPIHQIRLSFHPSASTPGKGTAAIIVPTTVTVDKPYVVTRTVAPDGKVCGTMIGYFERILDKIPQVSAGTLRAQLKDGMRFGEFSERLTNIEVMLAQRLPSGEPDAQARLSASKLAEKLIMAKAAVNRIGKPNIVLAVTVPGSVSSFLGLFESPSSSLVRLIEQPPVLRRDGFSIKVPKPSSIIKGELRRCVIPGYELVDLWKDATLIAVGPGDYDLLCWARSPQEGVGLPIRNFVLAEVVLNFVGLASQVFKHAQPAPKRLEFFLQLENMTVNGLPSTLSSERDNIRFPRWGETKTAPDSIITSKFEADFENMDVGKVVYELLAKIYEVFGFNHSDMPYVANEEPKRITPTSMFIGIEDR